MQDAFAVLFSTITTVRIQKSTAHPESALGAGGFVLYISCPAGEKGSRRRGDTKPPRREAAFSPKVLNTKPPRCEAAFSPKGLNAKPPRREGQKAMVFLNIPFFHCLFRPARAAFSPKRQWYFAFRPFTIAFERLNQVDRPKKGNVFLRIRILPLPFLIRLTSNRPKQAMVFHKKPNNHCFSHAKRQNGPQERSRPCKTSTHTPEKRP